MRTPLRAADRMAGLPADLIARLTNPRRLGAPLATDVDFTPILPLLNLPAINLGDPWQLGREDRNVKDVERQVVDRMLALFGATGHLRERWWGYIGSGSTASIAHCLDIGARTVGRTRLGRGPVLYHSTAAHPCVPAAARKLRLPTVAVPILPGGAIDPVALAARVQPRRPAVLLVTAGTTMSEAVDDLSACRAALRALGAGPTWVHTDAALAGVPLAQDLDGPPAVRLDHPDGPDSLTISGQKFMATLAVSSFCAVRVQALGAVCATLAYTSDLMVTAEGCRSGHDVLRWHHVLATLGHAGLRARTLTARAEADRVVTELQRLGVGARRHAHAFTVVARAADLGEFLIDKWHLFVQGQADQRLAHLIAMPGRPGWVFDEFLAEAGNR